MSEYLAGIYERYELLYRRGEDIAVQVRRTFVPVEVQKLLDAVRNLSGPELPAAVRVVSWLVGAGPVRTVTKMLALPAARPAALEALVRKGTSVTEFLVAELQAPDLEVRRAAVTALGRIGDERAVPALLALLGQNDELLVLTAAALAMIGDDRAYAPLRDLLGHGDGAVRRAAISALNSLAHRDTAADMLARMTDPDPRAARIGDSRCGLRRLRGLHRAVAGVLPRRM